MELWAGNGIIHSCEVKLGQICPTMASNPKLFLKKGALFSKESVILRGPLFQKPIIVSKTNVINRLNYHDLQYARVFSTSSRPKSQYCHDPSKLVLWLLPVGV
jgi:hypothetical protein